MGLCQIFFKALLAGLTNQHDISDSFAVTPLTLGSYLALGRLLSDCDTATEFFAEASTDNESFFW